MNRQQFKYFAFISYSSKDKEWGRRVQRKLEHYKMPVTLCSEHGWERKPMAPVFLDQTDIQPGGLTNELHERLQASRNLIVICSPNSAQSEWVGKEIAYFHQLGRTKQIHFFIVDGQPHSGNPATECFNPIVEVLGLQEILGANIHEKVYRWSWLNKERAYVQLISKLLGVEFDAIWQRHKRLLVQRAIAWTIGILAVIAALTGVWITNQPVDVEVRLNEASVRNPNLPPLSEAVVTMTLDNETKTDTIRSLDEAVVFVNIPHRFLNRNVSVKVACTDYMDVDTTLVLGKRVVLNMYRNPAAYGDIHFRLWNPDKEAVIPHVALEIAGQTVSSDSNGFVSLAVPLESQQVSYHVTASSPFIDATIMSNGKDDILIVENE